MVLQEPVHGHLGAAWAIDGVTILQGPLQFNHLAEKEHLRVKFSPIKVVFPPGQRVGITQLQQT
jgi:hypothetical protein